MIDYEAIAERGGYSPRALLFEARQHEGVMRAALRLMAGVEFDRVAARPTTEQRRGEEWAAMWFRVDRPHCPPLLPRWLAPGAWRRYDRIVLHYERACQR